MNDKPADVRPRALVMVQSDDGRGCRQVPKQVKRSEAAVRTCTDCGSSASIAARTIAIICIGKLTEGCSSWYTLQLNGVESGVVRSDTKSGLITATRGNFLSSTIQKHGQNFYTSLSPWQHRGRATPYPAVSEARVD